VLAIHNPVKTQMILGNESTLTAYKGSVKVKGGTAVS